MLNILQQINDKTNTRVLGQVLLSKKNKELFNWILDETKNLTNVTIKERVNYLLLKKPNLICKNGNIKKFVPRSNQYGFCNQIKQCECFQDHLSKQSRGRDMHNVIKKRKKTWLQKYRGPKAPI